MKMMLKQSTTQRTLIVSLTDLNSGKLKVNDGFVCGHHAKVIETKNH